ncbi:MAG: histidine phosphatase family protein [Candidatus Kapabacteria bacterium]|nr:histidine phosphatase family protein [Candidatus Kapabacteria bacterium]
MKTLFVVRHAKSDWSTLNQSDKERVLNPRGIRDAPIVAAHVAELQTTPQLLISSTATRAASTAAYFIDALHLSPIRVVRSDAVYEASVKGLMEIVNSIDKEVTCAMLVGHNPGVTDLVRYLAEESFAHMPTCGVAVITFKHASSWQEIGRGTGQLEAFLYPKKISS